jgi:hypothetical protein
MVSNERLPASMRNPRRKKYKPTAIATDKRIARNLIGIKRKRQTVTVFPWIAAMIRYRMI